MIQKSEVPECCPICGYYLTTTIQFNGHRCVDPSHWIAAGRLAPTDYYQMAQLAARDGLELNQRLLRIHHAF